MKNDVYCTNPLCRWQGKWTELIIFPKAKYRQLCPDCGEQDSIVESDSINFDDEYRKEKRENSDEY